jgi:ATP-dependent helicase Lhr and Lhr-like helicase
METDPDVRELLRLRTEHQAIRESLPSAWNAFFARFDRLREVQTAVMPPLLAGRNALVIAPTASGKTEAVIAPLCERLAQQRWPGLSILLITPTRALVNDLYNRLRVPCDQMGIRLGRKTADHALSGPVSEQLLITTPESTESMLTFRRQVLDDVRAIVLDEIHLLDGTARGDQLRFLLNRLRKYLAHHRGTEQPQLQQVALSATIIDPDRTAAVYLGEQSQVIAVPGQREIDARVLQVHGDDIAQARQTMEAIAAFPEVEKALVFVNSRKQVDSAAEYYRHERLPGMPVYCHHGSLSKEEREETESRFKSASKAICVATMTLEVGIDIGDIDLIVCVDPPLSLPSFLQRIGRGCRRLQGRTRVLCIARDRSGELLFQAMISQARAGLPHGVAVAPVRRAVLVQQTLAYLRQVDKRRRTLEQCENVFTGTAHPPVDRALVRDVLSDMVGSKLLACRNEVYEPASRGADFIESGSIYSNMAPSPVSITLVDADSGRVVATVAGLGSDLRGVRIAGRSFNILPGDTGFVRKVRTGGAHTEAPRYHARCFSYAMDVGFSLRNHLQAQPDTLPVIERGEIVIVFTWLGQLLNLCLAEGIQTIDGNADDRSFALILREIQPAQILAVLRRAVEALGRANPLGGQRVEQVVDLGAHVDELSDEGKRRAREDWLDLQFLNRWVDGLRGIQLVPAEAPLAADLLSLVDI